MFSNTYFFVSVWLLLHGYFLVVVLDSIVALFQNGVLKYIFFVPAWMLLHVYVFG